MDILSNLKKGDIVKYRSGGESVVDSIKGGTIGKAVDVFFDGLKHSVCYHLSGNYFYDEKLPFDIIEVIPAPFDWSTVKNGMAFQTYGKSDTFVYIGLNASGLHLFENVCCHVTFGRYLTKTNLKNLIRFPDGDSCFTLKQR
tara:strand:- start:354 stop:779 length:426 start_codon:yes stop_codon:yes gene_type:complete